MTWPHFKIIYTLRFHYLNIYLCIIHYFFPYDLFSLPFSLLLENANTFSFSLFSRVSYFNNIFIPSYITFLCTIPLLYLDFLISLLMLCTASLNSLSSIYLLIFLATFPLTVSLFISVLHFHSINYSRLTSFPSSTITKHYQSSPLYFSFQE